MFGKRTGSGAPHQRALKRDPPPFAPAPMAIDDGDSYMDGDGDDAVMMESMEGPQEKLIDQDFFNKFDDDFDDEDLS
eukprot:tig00000310_g23952.t1